MCGPAPEHRLRRRRRESPAVGEPSPVTPQTQEVARRGVHISSRRSLVIPPCCPISLISSTDQAEDFAKDVDDLIAARQGGIALVVTDTLYPAIRNTHGAAQLEAARGARPSSRPEDRAVARATRSRCSCVVSPTGETVAAVATRGRHDRSRGRRRDPGDDARGRDGAQRGDRSRHGAPCRRLAARRRAPGPDAVLGLAAVPTTTDDGQPTMALRVVGATRAAPARPLASPQPP